MVNVFHFARPLLFALSPEDAHDFSLRMLECGTYPRAPSDVGKVLHTSAFGLNFPNPVGIAAGYDKDARVPDAVLKLGCGFAEVGTLTPKPQSGNPKPRVFRLQKDNAVINRLGFNNGGHAQALKRLEARENTPGIVAVNIGANKDSTDRVADYVAGIETFAHLASYFTVNISSPNTPGLRDLQAAEALDELLTEVFSARARTVAEGHPHRPIIVKIAPDLDDVGLEQTVEQLVAHNVDGIAVSNTTLSRAGLKSQHLNETGGLSGRPLFERATTVLARVYKLTDGKIPLIGIGGIENGATALEKIKAGATLLQLYTGLIYEGPRLIPQITGSLRQTCEAKGIASLQELRGISADRWASKSLTVAS